jgi:hypothetical protein
VREYAAQIGIGELAPHDSRRTAAKKFCGRVTNGRIDSHDMQDAHAAEFTSVHGFLTFVVAVLRVSIGLDAK